MHLFCSYCYKCLLKLHFFFDCSFFKCISYQHNVKQVLIKIIFYICLISFYYTHTHIAIILFFFFLLKIQKKRPFPKMEIQKIKKIKVKVQLKCWLPFVAITPTPLPIESSKMPWICFSACTNLNPFNASLLWMNFI